MDALNPAGASRRPGKSPLLRFPVGWTVANEKVERLFARLLWILVPLQFFVLTQTRKGLAGDDVIPVLALSLILIVGIFLLGFVTGWIATKWQRSGRDATTARVRMWVVALMVGVAGGYVLLALSVMATKIVQYFDYAVGIDTDFVMGGLLSQFGLEFKQGDWRVMTIQALSHFLYATVALMLIALVLRRFRGASDAEAQDGPFTILAGLFVALLMTAVNWIATR